MPDRELRGVYPILATPFDEEGRLDLTSQARLVNYLIDQGAHGLGLFGNASEGYALTGEERRHSQQQRTFPLTREQALLQFLLGSSAPKPANLSKLNQAALRERQPPR